ncbi:sensor histidine kinase [Neobacillus sp. PS3-40]|uniref:sensor histidine kinase n=1 Tax=Neobacillus sp. PS3-40 TaxID=3070679 RepID=UPI0027E1D700|nr:sensor histidine kinase [Neobacillus sp. PS3-40]WML42824.1 sensor histidine kinase [Neobacillus sp. PS3-40]
MLKRPFSILSLTRVFMFILLCSIYYSLCEDGELWRKTFIIIAILLFIGNHLLLFSSLLKPHYIWFILLDFVLSACFGFIFAGETNMYFIMFGILAVTLFIRTDNKKVLYTYVGLFFITWILISFTTFRITKTISFSENIINLMFIIYGAVVGDLIRKLLIAKEKIADQYEQLSLSHQELSDVHEQLRSYSKQVEELTVIRERNQIAREIHDTVGHKMTALLVQLQIAREFMNLDLEESKHSIQNCEGLAREALEEIRTSVRTLHEDDGLITSFISTLQKLLKDFSQMTTIEVSLEINGDLSATPTSIQPTINRIIQESLTNSKRHGNATKCHVSIDCKPDFIHLYIKDNGIGTFQIQPSFGLLNMRERAMEHGGSIHYESKEGHGFIVKANFPLKQLLWSTRGIK